MDSDSTNIPYTLQRCDGMDTMATYEYHATNVLIALDSKELIVYSKVNPIDL